MSFKCTIENCNMEFRHPYGLKEHMKSVHSTRVYCPYEGCYSFVKPRNLAEHVKSIHEKVKVTCYKCNQEFIKSSIYQHYKKCLTQEEMKSRKNLKLTPTLGTQLTATKDVQILYEKVKTNNRCIKTVTINGVKKYRCFVDGCQSILSNFNSLRSHVNIVHSDYPAWKESAKKKRVESLRQEKECQEIDSTTVCRVENCGKSFQCPSARTYHENRVHSKLAYCPMEGCKTVTKRGYVKEHLKYVHNITNPELLEDDILEFED